MSSLAESKRQPHRVPSQRRRPRGRPSDSLVRRARSIQPQAAPWWMAKRWPESPVADRRELHREIGARLTPTAHAILGLVRKAVRCRFAGLEVAAGELADRLDVTDRHVFRALRQLEELELVRRVHQFVNVGWVNPETGRRHARRQAASVLVLGEASKRPPARRRRRADFAARGRAEKVTPKPTPLSPNGERERGVAVEPESAAAPRDGAGCAGAISARSGSTTAAAAIGGALELATARAAEPEASTPPPGRVGAAPEGEDRPPVPGWLPGGPERLLALQREPVDEQPAPPPVPPVERDGVPATPADLANVMPEAVATALTPEERHAARVRAREHAKAHWAALAERDADGAA
jgi:DNA-binding transcriptional ArsR family regulator